jgi:hypothetical protein
MSNLVWLISTLGTTSKVSMPTIDRAPAIQVSTQDGDSPSFLVSMRWHPTRHLPLWCHSSVGECISNLNALRHLKCRG